jgi:hypothetical protein
LGGSVRVPDASGAELTGAFDGEGHAGWEGEFVDAPPSADWGLYVPSPGRGGCVPSEYIKHIASGLLA